MGTLWLDIIATDPRSAKCNTADDHCWFPYNIISCLHFFLSLFFALSTAFFSYVEFFLQFCCASINENIASPVLFFLSTLFFVRTKSQNCIRTSSLHFQVESKFQCVFFSLLFSISHFFSLTNCPIYRISTLNWQTLTTSDTARRTMNTRDWFGIKFSYANTFFAIKSSLNCRLNYFSSLRFSSKWLKGLIRRRPVFTRMKFENFKSKIVKKFNTNLLP